MWVELIAPRMIWSCIVQCKKAGFGEVVVTPSMVEETVDGGGE